MIKEILKIKNAFNLSRSNSSIKNKQPKDFESFRKFLDLARSEMNKNGLFDWKLDLDHAKVRAGACFFRERKISFSRNFIKNSNESEIYDTILHEIAHALVGPNHGHDIVWKKMAKKLGFEKNSYGLAAPIVGKNGDYTHFAWIGAADIKSSLSSTKKMLSDPGFAEFSKKVSGIRKVVNTTMLVRLADF